MKHYVMTEETHTVEARFLYQDDIDQFIDKAQQAGIESILEMKPDAEVFTGTLID